MTNQQQPNPLREGLSTKAVPQPCAVVIFGATGDLTHRKLVPALYNIAADGELPPAVAVIGFARRPKTDDEFRQEMEEATRNFSRQTVRDEIWKGFAKSLFYHQSEFGDEEGYKKLAERLDRLDQESGTRGNRLFYFAASPEQFETIVENLNKAGLNKAREGSWARVILEKPFGTDLDIRAAFESHRAALVLRKIKPTGSIISSGKKRRRTFWSCVLRTRFSSRSGTRVTSITFRSPPRKR